MNPGLSRTKLVCVSLLLAIAGRATTAQEDVADIRSKKYTLSSAKLQYYLIAAVGKLKAPADGYKLLIVLPGGDGSDDFLPFVKRIYKHALDREYLMIQLLAPKWTPNQLPDLKQAKGKHYYILHSPEDRVCPYAMAVSARDVLQEHGATVEFTEYPGGHGWRGNVFGNIRQGVEWLETESQQ